MSDLETLLVRHEGVRRYAYDDVTCKTWGLGRCEVTIDVLPARAPPRSPARPPLAALAREAKTPPEPGASVG